MAIVPDIVVYLKTDVASLIPRVIGSKGMDYWESGMDMHLAPDLYESFCAYQKMLLAEYDRMAEEFGFKVVDTIGRSPQKIQEDLRTHIEPLVRRPRRVDPKKLEIKRT